MYSANIKAEKSTFYGHSDCAVTHKGHVHFLSIVMSKSQADSALYYFNKYIPLYYEGNSFEKNEVEYFRHNARDNYVHLIFKQRLTPLARKNSIEGYISGVVFIKDEYDSDAKDTLLALRGGRTEDVPAGVIEDIYAIMSSNATVPMLKEWASYIIGHMDKYAFGERRLENHNCEDASYGFSGAISFDISEYDLRDIIRKGLANKEISVDGCNDISVETKCVTGMDSYLNTFGQVLVDNTSARFRPRFDPAKENVGKNVDGFYDVCSFYKPDTISFKTQKNVMEAGVRCLDHHDAFLLAAATGCGKTLMGIGTVTLHARKSNFATLVMAPPTLINDWKEAIEAVVPMAEVRVIENLHDMMQCGKIAKNPLRMKSFWCIISINTIKTDYEMRPAVVWSKSKKCYVCPHCGKPISISNARALNGRRETTFIASALDFMKQNDKNTLCKNVLDRLNGYKVSTGCGQKLWTAATRDNSSDWVNIKGIGWLQKSRIDSIYDTASYYIDHMHEDAPPTLREKYRNIVAAIDTYRASGSVERFPNRYSIARYIHKHLNHVFDYLIADEVHQLAADSLQGQAFGTVINSVWKGIFLTGTLANGYASGLFHLLFRTQSRKMLDNGYGHDDMSKFEHSYGVFETTETRVGHYTSGRDRSFVCEGRPKKVKKHLPGISPTLVTDYLMNVMVSIEKKDIRKNLCKYTETPIGVDMDDELKHSYDEILKTITIETKGADGKEREKDARNIKHAVLTANMFLDQPYGLEITSNGENENVTDLDLSPEVIRPKERELLKIAAEKKEAGEKMLIYCEYTEKLDIINRLATILNDAGIKATGMKGVKPADRGAWLQKQTEEGVDAIILNPKLVEVGLNLLDYTTIIFYEIGTKIHTVRQASQRSNRINQTKPVSVYFLYYNKTIQEDALGAISQKLKACKAVEGYFSESALENLADDTDILTKLVNSIVKNEHIEVRAENFDNSEEEEKDNDSVGEVYDSTTAVTMSPYFDRELFSFMEPKETEYVQMMIA